MPRHFDSDTDKQLALITSDILCCMLAADSNDPNNLYRDAVNIRTVLYNPGFPDIRHTLPIIDALRKAIKDSNAKVE